MIIIGTSALRLKNSARARRPRLVPSTPSRTVAPVDPPAVQEVADGDERGGAPYAFLAADVDRELGRLAERLGYLGSTDFTGEQAGTLEGDQSAPFDLQHAFEQRLDSLTIVHRNRYDG